LIKWREKRLKIVLELSGEALQDRVCRAAEGQIDLLPEVLEGEGDEGRRQKAESREKMADGGWRTETEMTP
jgi:hypothetical protein